jgi:hypothetical protein
MGNWNVGDPFSRDGNWAWRHQRALLSPRAAPKITEVVRSRFGFSAGNSETERSTEELWRGRVGG